MQSQTLDFTLYFYKGSWNWILSLHPFPNPHGAPGSVVASKGWFKDRSACILDASNDLRLNIANKHGIDQAVFDDIVYLLPPITTNNWAVIKVVADAYSNLMYSFGESPVGSTLTSNPVPSPRSQIQYRTLTIPSQVGVAEIDHSQIVPNSSGPDLLDLIPF